MILVQSKSFTIVSKFKGFERVEVAIASVEIALPFVASRLGQR